MYGGGLHDDAGGRSCRGARRGTARLAGSGDLGRATPTLRSLCCRGGTATLYTADGLAGELKRLAARPGVHSISLCGSDALANADYLAAVFSKWTPSLPVMVDTDGQRPEALEHLGTYITLVQVTVGFGGSGALVDRAIETLATAARGKHDHALVLVPREDTSDGQLLRIVEQASAVSNGTMIVVHPPPPSGDPVHLDRRWSALVEQAAALHGDVRLVLRIPSPAGMR